MSQPILLCALGLVGLMLSLALAAAPIRWRPATYAAAVLSAALGYAIWRVAAFIAPMGVTFDARDPVEAFDLWMTGAVVLLGLGVIPCLVRLARVALEARPGHRVVR
jgi:hypothetical protein